MADELTISIRAQLAKSKLKADANPGTVTVTVAGTRKCNQVQDIGTTHEQLAVGSDFGTPGYGYFRNLDATNYVEIGTLDGSTFESFATLFPGQPALIPLTTKNIYAKANTASVQLEYLLIER